MFTIDYGKLHSLESTFVIYEIASHGVDPRETLEGTTFRIYEREGYKQQIYDEIHERIVAGGPYVDIVNDALSNNLVDYHQKLKVANLIESENRSLYEETLSSLYAGNNDETAFKEVVDAFGANFDVIGALFFFKDSERYLPIRSGIFDERFRILGADAGLAGNCSWEKYQEYNETVKAIQEDLNRNINEDITFIDAHSFVWVLKGVAEYADSVQQPVEHKTLGKGVIIDSNDDTITVKFANSKKPTTLLKSIAIDEGKLTFIDPGFDIDGPDGGVKNTKLREAIASIKAAEVNKYIVILSGSGNSVYMDGYLRSPYHDITGKPLHYWDTLSRLKPGDIVFKYYEGCIDAVGIVTSFCTDVPISDLKGETAEWGDTRRQVEYKPYPLNERIKISRFKDEIIKFRKEKYSAFNKDGGANEGYLYELEPEIADLFERAIGIDANENSDGRISSDNSESYTITQADYERLKAQDAKMTPEERRAVSKGLVEANSAANAMAYDVSFEEKPLSNKAIEVAEALLKLIVNRTRLTTYGELSDMTKSKPSPYYEMRMLLDAINKLCDKLSLPYISAMVVNKSTGLPGDGFRDLCIDVFGYDPEMTTEEIFEEELDRIGKCDEWSKLAEYLGIEMPTEDEEPLPEEVEDVPGKPIIEGAKKTITVNSYERDPKAKKICKDYYMRRDGRITCQVCGFDFGEVYGPEYANKIHVHHIVPVSEIGEEYIVDPIKDLIPVCPNCHMILHTGRGISAEDLKKKINK